MVSFE